MVDWVLKSITYWPAIVFTFFASNTWQTNLATIFSKQPPLQLA